MIGDVELARLAELLKLSSETARDIARARATDRQEIFAMADQMREMAIRLAKIAQNTERTPTEGGRPAPLP